MRQHFANYAFQTLTGNKTLMQSSRQSNSLKLHNQNHNGKNIYLHLMGQYMLFYITMSISIYTFYTTGVSKLFAISLNG